MKSLLFSRKGQAMVEMAFVLPVLLLFLLGIIEFGWILGGYVELQSAVRDVTRHESIYNETLTNAQIIDKVKARLTSDKFTTMEVTNFTRGDSVELQLHCHMKLMTSFFGDIELNPKMVMKAEYVI